MSRAALKRPNSAAAGGSAGQGEGGTPGHEYLVDAVATQEEGRGRPLVRLRFPRNSRVYGIPPLSDPSSARLPAALLARLDFSRLQAAC